MRASCPAKRILCQLAVQAATAATAAHWGEWKGALLEGRVRPS